MARSSKNQTCNQSNGEWNRLNYRYADQPAAGVVSLDCCYVGQIAKLHPVMKPQDCNLKRLQKDEREKHKNSLLSAAADRQWPFATTWRVRVADKRRLVTQSRHSALGQSKLYAEHPIPFLAAQKRTDCSPLNPVIRCRVIAKTSNLESLLDQYRFRWVE